MDMQTKLRKAQTSFWSQRERTCNCCGKEFICTPEWAWKFDDKLVCSYSCMRKMEHQAETQALKKHEENEGLLSTKQLTDEKVVLIKDLYKSGKKPKEICDITGFSQYAVYNALRRKTNAVAFRHLPDGTSEIMQEMRKGGMPYAEIARRFKCSEMTVRRRVAGEIK